MDQGSVIVKKTDAGNTVILNPNAGQVIRMGVILNTDGKVSDVIININEKTPAEAKTQVIAEGLPRLSVVELETPVSITEFIDSEIHEPRDLDAQVLDKLKNYEKLHTRVPQPAVTRPPDSKRR